MQVNFDEKDIVIRLKRKIVIRDLKAELTKRTSTINHITSHHITSHHTYPSTEVPSSEILLLGFPIEDPSDNEALYAAMGRADNCDIIMAVSDAFQLHRVCDVDLMSSED